MGCDIHVVLERKIEDKWQGVFVYRVTDANAIQKVEPYDGRNYELFSILAGVRGSHEPLIDPRGLPNDMSGATLEIIDWWEGDYHTPTWYDMFELNTFADRYKDNEEYARFIDFVKYLNIYFEYALLWYWSDVIKPNQYRAIIFFDN